MALSFFGDTLSVAYRHRSLRYLLLARLASVTGTYLALIALTVGILERTGSATWVSLLLRAEFLPAFVLAFFVGPLTDR